ncbi:unnamed protein product [Lathyrus sativus]|nr:unnamed protein product [Lathyrus sativus]
MNVDKIHTIKRCPGRVIHLNGIEDQLLKQRTKIDWLKNGDKNSAYFYAMLKIQIVQNQILNLVNNDGVVLTTQKDIE